MSHGIFFDLGVALAAGLLIGTERGWEQREQKEGSRIAGIRTFGLIGLIGGVTAVLGRETNDIAMLAVGVASFALVLAAVIIRDTPTHTDRGATTILALFATFVVGALAGWGGEPMIPITVAAVMTIMLGTKKSMHGWLGTIDTDEMNAAFKLLLVSAVVLPLLPDKNYGPWDALNPYQIWWMVVLISTISFAGFFAMRSTSATRGLILTSIFGGLASSTAISVAFGKLGRTNAGLQKTLAAGVLIASTIMEPRQLVVAAVGSPALALYLVPPVTLMALTGVAATYPLLRASEAPGLTHEMPMKSSFDLSVPLRFGLVFAGILLAVGAVRHWYGDSGLYGVAVIAGLTDVDAITLSLAHNIGQGLAVDVAARAAILAALSNSVVKGGVVAVMCGGVMARRVALGFGAITIAGVIGIIFGNFGITISSAAFGG